MSYTTTFQGIEKPLSEGGVWVNGGAVGGAWTDVQKANGAAFDTLGASGPGVSSFQDSIAHIDPAHELYPAHQRVTCVITLSNVQGYHEVEMLLRFKITPGFARGYETLIASVGNCSIVRWNGAHNDFTVLNQVSGIPVVVGDTFSDEIDDNHVITVKRNGVQINSIDLKTVQGGTLWTDGQPGIGFDTNTDIGPPSGIFGWASFLAEPLSTVSGSIFSSAVALPMGAQETPVFSVPGGFKKLRATINAGDCPAGITTLTTCISTDGGVTFHDASMTCPQSPGATGPYYTEYALADSIQPTHVKIRTTAPSPFSTTLTVSAS